MRVPRTTLLLPSRLAHLQASWGTPGTPHMSRHGKGDLDRLQPPKTCLPFPWHSSTGTRGLKVCLHPVYTCSGFKAACSPTAEGWRGEMSPPGTHRPWQTWPAAPHPTGSPERGPGADRVLHSHPHNSRLIWDLGGPGPGGIPGTSAPQPKGWQGSPGQDQDVPKSGAEAAGRQFINSIQRSFGLFIYPAANSVCCFNPHLEIIQRNPPAQPSPEAGHKPAATWSCSTSSPRQQLGLYGDLKF